MLIAPQNGDKQNAIILLSQTHSPVFDSQWHLLFFWRGKVWDALLYKTGLQWYLIK